MMSIPNNNEYNIEDKIKIVSVFHKSTQIQGYNLSYPCYFLHKRNRYVIHFN